MVILSYVGTDLNKKTERELLEMLSIPNLNSVSKTEINMELRNRLDKLPKPIK